MMVCLTWRFAEDQGVTLLDNLAEWLVKVVQRLDELDSDYALVGGVAVGVRTEPRFTRDIDLAVAVVSDAEAEGVTGHLIRYGYRLIQELDQLRHDRIATMRLISPGVLEAEAHAAKPPVVDLLFGSCGIEPEIVAAATPVQVYPRTIMRVAQVPHLIAMKILSASDRRPQDAVDLHGLIGEASEAELTTARQLVQLIMDRGYHRDRDLPTMLEDYIRRWK